MHPISPHEIRTPPPRFRGDPEIRRPCFCGPRSPTDGWDRCGPRRRPTGWGTWPPNLSPPYRPTLLRRAVQHAGVGVEVVLGGQADARAERRDAVAARG